MFVPKIKKPHNPKPKNITIICTTKNGRTVSKQVDKSTKIYKLSDLFLNNHHNITYYSIMINDSIVENIAQTVNDFSKNQKKLKLHFQEAQFIQFTLYTANNLLGENIRFDTGKNEDFLKLLHIKSDKNSFFIFNSKEELLKIDNTNYKKIIRSNDNYYLVQYPLILYEKIKPIESLASKELTMLFDELIKYLPINSTELQQLLCIFYILDENEKLKTQIFDVITKNNFIPLSYSARTFIAYPETRFFCYRLFLLFLFSLPALTKSTTKNYIEMFDQLFQESIQKVSDDISPFTIINSYEIPQFENIQKGAIIHINANNNYCVFIEKSKNDPRKLILYDPYENKQFEFIQNKRINFENIFFNKNQFTFSKEKIGNGGYGKVYPATDNETHQKSAAKKFKIKYNFDVHEQKSLMRESLINYKLNHPSIVKFLGLNVESNVETKQIQPTILTEYMPNKDLQYLIDRKNEEILTPTQKYIYLIQIAHAMKYLHRNKIAHRDLKPSNILIDENYNLRICDFGLSRCFPSIDKKVRDATMSGSFGTISYIAPELFNKIKCDPLSLDIYSFAIVAYSILTVKKAYFELKENEKTALSLSRLVDSGKRPKFTKDITPKMRDLLSRCWNQNPLERPNFNQIYDELISSTDFVDGEIDINEVKKCIEMLNTESDPSDLFVFNNIYVHISEIDKIFFDFEDFKQIEQISSNEQYNTYKFIKYNDDDDDDENEKEEKFYFGRICKMDNFTNYQLMLLIRESLMMSKLNNPLITKFVGFNFQSSSNSTDLQPTMLFEYVPNGTLEDILSGNNVNNKWDINKKAITILSIAYEMFIMHEKGIIHGLLNPSNILFDENFYPKIKFPHFFTDYLCNSDTYSNYELRYKAPESISDNDSNAFLNSIDVFSFAVISFEILDGKNLFDLALAQSKSNISNCLFKIRNGFRPKFSENLTENMNKLISQCWNVSYDLRPSFAQIFRELANNLSYFGDGLDLDMINQFFSYINFEPF